MSEESAYFSRMVEKHLSNTDVKSVNLRDESPDLDSWTIDVVMDDGRKILIEITEMSGKTLEK